MNDPMEVYFGVSLINSVMEEEKNDLGKSEAAIIDRFDQFLANATDDLLLDVYNFSMSQHGDRLSQWRSYGVDGAGVSVGFDKKRMLALSSQGREVSFFLTPLAYKEAHQDYLRLAISKVMNDLISDVLGGTDEKLAFSNTFRQILPVLLVLKSEEYQEEYEWRLLMHVDNSRSKSDVFKEQDGPFLDVPLDYVLGPSLSFDEIIMGPCASDNISRDKVRKISREANVEFARVNSSAIKYRNHKFFSKDG